MKVKEIYTRGTVHIPRSRNLQEAAIQMRDQHIGALVVTDGAVNNHIAGVVTDRDMVVKALAKGANPVATTVGDVMTGGVMTVPQSADVSDAMQTMFSHGIRRLAVTDHEGGVVGMLSLDDVIQAMSHDLSQLASIVRSEQQRERTGSVQSPLHP